MQNAAATPRFFMFVVRRRAVPCLHANASAGNTYNNAMELEQVLKACGDDLSTGIILKQAYAIQNLDCRCCCQESCASTARRGNASPDGSKSVNRRQNVEPCGRRSAVMFLGCVFGAGLA
jgi:hypothetical protein